MMKIWRSATPARGWRRCAALLAGLAAVLLLAGAEGGCAPEEGSQHPSAPRAPDVRDAPKQQPGGGATAPDPVEGDPNPHGWRGITVRFRIANKGQVPGEGIVTTSGGAVKPVGHHEVIGSVNTVVVTLSFDPKAPTPLVITARLSTSRPGAGNWCGIEAGTFGNDGPRFTVEDQAGVTCYLTIKRPR